MTWIHFLCPNLTAHHSFWENGMFCAAWFVTVADKMAAKTRKILPSAAKKKKKKKKNSAE